MPDGYRQTMLFFHVHFPACTPRELRAADGTLVRFLLTVDASEVVREIALLSERPRATSALIGLLSRVQKLVGLEGRPRGERFPAERTDERSLLRVRSFVLHQLRLGSETAATVSALVRSLVRVRPLVGPSAGCARKHLIAEFTGEGFFACVSPPVEFEVRFFLESLLAGLALIRLLVGMDQRLVRFQGALRPEKVTTDLTAESFLSSDGFRMKSLHVYRHGVRGPEHH